MTREKKYAEQMRELGIYHQVFDPAIHTLAIMEREHQRSMKTLRTLEDDGDAKVISAMRAEIAQQRRDILAHREALGLTPRALRRLRTDIAAGKPVGEPPTVLALLRAKHEKEA